MRNLSDFKTKETVFQGIIKISQETMKTYRQEEYLKDILCFALEI